MNTEVIDPATGEIVPSTSAASRPLATQLPGAVTPYRLLEIAVQSGADLDRLERLMALQEKWEAREAEKAYNVAFAEFKATAVQVLRNRTVTDGPLKGKSYAELHAWVNAVTPALSEHGLSASWRLTIDDRDWLQVTCRLKHTAGHFEEVSMGGPPDAGGAKNAIQARASTITYLERHTLKAITGLSDQSDDDDGNGSGGESIPPELMKRANEAAAKGVAVYGEFWSKITKDERKVLAPAHASLKKTAERVPA